MEIPDHLTCLLRNLYAGQEATVRTGHGTTEWFQIGKGVCQGCILLPCLFNFYAEYIMRNAGLEEATDLEPDILECEVKWALGSITTNKARGGDGIPVELFQVLKDDAVKVVQSMSANLENSAVEKVSFHSNPPKGNTKECSNYLTVALISR